MQNDAQDRIIYANLKSHRPSSTHRTSITSDALPPSTHNKTLHLLLSGCPIPFQTRPTLSKFIKMSATTTTIRRGTTTTAAILTVAAAHVTVVALAGWWRLRRRGRGRQQPSPTDDDDDDADGPEAAYLAFRASVPPRSIVEFEEAAMRTLPPLSRTYFQYYSDQAVTAGACRTFYNSIRLLPTILTGDVSEVDTRLEIFGETLDLPVLVAPTAFHTLACVEGEVATARGAGAGGAGYCYNWMLSSRLYSDVLHEDGVKWLHLYIFEERGLVEAAIERALASGGFSAIILSCDHPHQRVQVRNCRMMHPPASSSIRTRR